MPELWRLGGVVAEGAAVRRLAGRDPDLYAVAELAYVAEREVLGVPCGRLDQYGSVFGRVNHVKRRRLKPC